MIAASVMGALSIASVSIGASAADASASSVASKPITGLLPASTAKALGFPKVAQKPTGSSKTGQAGCPKGAEAAYEDSANQTGLIAEVLSCNTAKVAASTLSGQKKAVTLPTSQTPPKALGPTAFERATSQTTYAIVWQRAKLLSVVAIDINVPASSSTSTTAPTTATPLTAKQQQTLSNAALAQDKALK